MGKNRKSKKEKRKGLLWEKGQIWGKGQSSSFNAGLRKHRDMAKRRTLYGSKGDGQLTQQALAQHDQFQGNKNTGGGDDDVMSVGNKSFVTVFSDCSNPAFSRLMKGWQSNSLLHKEMIAVLAAVTEVIKSKGGKETETEYFAALMTTLSVVDTDEATTAVVSLLSMVVKKLPVSVLRIKFADSCQMFVKFLTKYIDSAHNALLRNLLGCLYQFLKVQEPKVWDKSTSQMYSVLLEFSIHQKPKVRKTAQGAIVSILWGSEKTEGDSVTSCYPASTATAQFFLKKMESSASSSSPQTYHLLGLLKDVIGSFPKAILKSCCETVLRIMTLSDAIISSSCLKTFLGLFTSKPKPESLPAELNAKIVTALYDYQPNVNDEIFLIDWLAVMEAAFINLYSLDPKLCINHLPHFFNIAVKCWTSQQPEVWATVEEGLKSLLHSCIEPSNPEFQRLLREDPITNPMCKMFHSVEGALIYQYHLAWKEVLNVLASFFDVIGKYCYPVMIKCLRSIADLRDSYQFIHIAELDKAIGFAILRMGPQVILKAIPLQINGENDKMDFPRSWLLPLLRDNVNGTDLGFFTVYFLPLAGKIKRKVEELEEAKRVVESATYKVLLLQIWSLLPAFCTKPTDLKQAFPNIARILGTALSDHKDLGLYILRSLRFLIDHSLDDDENKFEMSKYAKNYLPILFNLYTVEPKDKIAEKFRLSVYNTIQTYLKITEKELCLIFFNKAMEKLRDPSMTLFTQHALLDLNRVVLPYIDEQQIEEFYEYCKPLLQYTNHTIQKKSYAVMKGICCSSSESCALFVRNSLEELKSLFVTSLSISAPSSKALRLNCLQCIISKLTEENKEFVISVVPEAVLCTKENSVKARSAAFYLLVEIGHTFKRWNPSNCKDALYQYMQLLLAGLAGSPHLMSASILSIGRIMFEFKDDLDSNLIHLLIENMCLLLSSPSREVVMSALSFIKILFATVETADLAQHVEYLVKSIVSISEDNQRHFRFKAKEIFTRLVRKFGYEIIAKLVPDTHHKQLVNIKKTEARKSKRKNLSNLHESDCSDDDMLKIKGKSNLIDDILADSEEEFMDRPVSKEVLKKGSKRLKKSSKAPWIEECENDIVDLLDPSASSKILTTKPRKVENKEKSPRASFPITSDGRLYITDNEKGDKGMTSKGEESISKDNTLEDNKSNKRKFEDLSDEEDDPSYQHGGKGIHRPPGKISSEKNPGFIYKAKKAGGDSKKGRFEPYAYIPLNRKVLNKRQRGKLGGQYKNIVRGAQKGALRGSKMKSKNVKRKA